MPVALLAELRRRGVEVAVHGDRLRYRPATALPPELREALAAHKAGLLALLAEPWRLEEEHPPVERPCPNCGREAGWWWQVDGGWRCAGCDQPNASNAATAGHSPDSWQKDPRPDLAEDSALWSRLLALAWDHDGENPQGLFGSLHALRGCGAGLAVGADGRVRLVAGELSEAYGDLRERWLLPHRETLTKLLAQLLITS